MEFVNLRPRPTNPHSAFDLARFQSAGDLQSACFYAEGSSHWLCAVCTGGSPHARILGVCAYGSWEASYARSTRLSTTFLSKAFSNAMVSLLPSIFTTWASPNFWWNTRSSSENSELVPVDFATSSPSIVIGPRLLRVFPDENGD